MSDEKIFLLIRKCFQFFLSIIYFDNYVVTGRKSKWFYVKTCYIYLNISEGRFLEKNINRLIIIVVLFWTGEDNRDMIASHRLEFAYKDQNIHQGAFRK